MFNQFNDDPPDNFFPINNLHTPIEPIDNFQSRTFYEPERFYNKFEPIEPPRPIYREDPLRAPIQQAQAMPYMHMHPSLRPPGM